jgi:hypothetical protein
MCSWYVWTYSCEELRILAGGAHVCLDVCGIASRPMKVPLLSHAACRRARTGFTPWAVLLYNSILVFGGANGSSGAVGCRSWEGVS